MKINKKYILVNKIKIILHRDKGQEVNKKLM